MTAPRRRGRARDCFDGIRLLLLRLLVPAALLAPACVAAIEYGVNLHYGSTAEHNERVATLMQERNFSSARLDLNYDRPQDALRDQIRRIRARGGRAQVVLLISYHWDERCSQDHGFVERDAYAQALAAAGQVVDLVEDFELLNEPQLRPDVQREVAWNSAGADPAPYRNQRCVGTLAAVLRGMSRAIADLRVSTGRPLRTILGMVGRDFGFLTFMEESGVLFDVVGYHSYPRADHGPLAQDAWYGPGGLFQQLGALRRPVHVNEFNCGEIYDRFYSDAPRSPSLQACLQGMARHLAALAAQRTVQIESVHFYELLDEPAKKPPENRFGLMTDLGSPKPHLALATAFAGGALTAAERRSLVARGLLTDLRIDALREAARSRGASR